MTKEDGGFITVTITTTEAECWTKFLNFIGAFTHRVYMKRKHMQAGLKPLRIKIIGGVHE